MLNTVTENNILLGGDGGRQWLSEIRNSDASFITPIVIHGLAPCTFKAQTNRREILT